jgi:hypothetical protein
MIFDTNGISRKGKLLNQCTPVDIINISDTQITTSRAGIYQTKSSKKIKKTSLEQEIRQRSDDPLFNNIMITVDETDIQQHLLQPSTFDIATDGSYNKNNGIASYGWAIAMNTTVIAKAQGPVAAHPNLSTPFRAEVYRIASALAFI